MIFCIVKLTTSPDSNLNMNWSIIPNEVENFKESLSFLGLPPLSLPITTDQLGKGGN